MKRKLTFLLIAFLLLTGTTSWGQLRTVITDQLDRELTGVTGTSYTSWEGKTSNSDAVYAGLSAGGNESIQLRSNNSNSGIITTASGGMVTNVTVIWNESTADSRTLQVYGSHTAYTSPTELYSADTFGELLGTIVKGESDELAISGSYEYIGLRSASGAMYLSEIDITWNTEGGTPQETVATPTFSPEAGTYSEAQLVNISCATEGATIFYTIDGTNPTESSTEYTEAITIAETTTLKAFAMKEGYLDSEIATATYIISEAPSLITIAEARALAINEYALVQGVVTFIDGRNVYIQDETAGIDLFLNSNTVPSALALGDMVQAYGKKAVYNGLAELSGINGNDAEQFSILSSGNTLPLVVKTIAEILEGGADALQCTRVKVENATIGAINTNGNTPLTQDGASINIYKVPTLTGIEEGDLVDVISVIGYFNVPQLRVALASDVVMIETPSSLTASPMELSGFEYEYEAGGPSEIQSFTLSGELLTHNVNIIPSESFDISTMPAQYFQPENPATIYIPSSGHFYDIPIYVRMKAGLEVGTYTEQIAVTSENTGTLYVTVSGTVTGNDPTPPPTPVEGEYIRISDMNQLVPGSFVVFAARFDENASDYYAMGNSSSGKPEGVLFSSSTSEGNEILPTSITDEESSFYWIVGVTGSGYTFTNAVGELIGYTSGTNFATGGDNTEWAITMQTSEEGAMVPNYTGFVVGNVNTPVRAFALNSNHNFGPYHTQNMGGSSYNFFLDLFVKTEGGEPPVPPTPTVATPTFTPAAGTYYEPQTVSIACSTSGATIFYSTTSENGPWTEYEEALTVDENTTLWAYAVKESYNDSNVATATYTIQVGVATIFNQDWEGEMNGWTFVDVEGEMTWTVATYQGNHYAYANGYNHGANEDWCISPAFNLDAISNPTLTFRTAKNYNGPDLEVFFSNDYDGSNPATATWTPLTCALSSGSWTWTESGNISLGSFSGTNCYIGFKYTCGEDSAAGWEVDDILLFGQTSAPVVTVTPLALNGFTYTDGNGPSNEQSFTVSGFNLSSNITVTASTDYEISQTSGSGFTQSSITLAPIGGNVEDATIYIRLKAGLAVGNYNQNISVGCADVDDILVTCSGTVTAQPIPGGDYVRISDVSELVDGSRVIFAARFDENASDYYAMTNSASGKPEGVLFTSANSGSSEILPASIIDEEDNFYWTVDVTADGYTFTNAAGDLIGYTSSTNFSPNGDNTAWSIEIGTSEEGAMVPNYTGFIIGNVNNPNRAFALNGSHNFGAYHIQNIAGETYNFFLDLFVKSDGGVPPTPTVATPTFNPQAGTYSEELNVSIACATNGATIYYSTVSASGPWTPYTGAISVSETMTIWAYAEKEGYNDSNIAEATYTIQPGMVTIFNQDWEGEMNGWTFVTVEGNKPWTIGQYQGNHYANANGYNGGVNEQWCISPAFNINDYQNVILTFRNAKNYNGPDLELKYSTNYDGVDPTTANWWTFDFNMSPGSYTWVESGDIPISIYPAYSTNCYIAFKYTSTENEAAAWEVDDITLVGATSVPNLTATPSSLSGFTHVVGEGPSASQSFTLSGVNIGPAPGGGSTGSVVMQVNGNGFEISLDNETFSWQQYIDGISGTLPPTPVYVRLNGSEVGQYSGIVNIYSSSSDQTTVSLSGTVTEPPVPGDDYVRISDVSQLVDGNHVVFAARFDENATDYYAMSNAASGKPEGVLFTSTTNEGNEILPASILNEENNFYWTVNVTSDGYTFTNAAGDLIGYTTGTNFSPNGDNTAWSIEINTSEGGAMVPNYTGFVISNVNYPARAFALNGNHNFGPYHTQNMGSESYNFFLDIFMQGEGGSCTVAAPTFSPAGGTYYEPQEVTISCATEGATIWYSHITENGPWTPYTEPITVEEFAAIWAYATKEGCNDSPVVYADYIIQDDLTIIFNQDWEDDWNGWTEVCVAGDSLWHIGSYGGNHYAYANGYNHPATEDWLISPAFDLDSYDDVILSFKTAMNYTGPDLELLFSNDYDGQDPTAATWQSLDFEPSQGGWNWVETSVSLNDFNGTNCYIAFKYTCNDEAAGWEVDDIMLYSGSVSSDPYLNVTPDALSGFSHIVGQGPSEAQTFILSGGNFLPLPGGGYGGVWLSLGDLIYNGFEMSLDGEEYTSNSLYIELDETLTLEPTTVYVRLWGEEVGPYSGTIYIEEPSGVSVSVALTGTVLSENEPAILMEFMPLYIQGNNGSNNNRVPVATEIALTNLEPNTTYRYTNQFVDDNDGPETAGAGNVIYANESGFYRSTSPSLATEGNYGEFTTNQVGDCIFWFINEPTANARFTPGNHVYLRIRINDGHDGTTVAHTFTTQNYATVLNFGKENDEYSGSAFYAKSNENPMTFAMLYASSQSDWRPVYSTLVETTGVDFGSINQYADFYKESVAGNDGWFGGILPNDNETGVNSIWIYDINGFVENKFETQDGQWAPEANTVNPTNGLDEPIFIDLTYDGVEEQEVEANIKVWNADHEFVIENGDNAHYSMTVYNILGQPMMMKQINAGSTERISHSLASGVYVISLQNNKNKVSVKVIVK